MNNIMADYVKLPELDEYKEWFKDHFELYREDGILQITMHTNGHRMCWSGSNHRAMSQLSRVISMDRKNEIIIWTHKGDYWMTDKDPYGWQTYAEERFEHQFIDDTNLIKNMIFDIDVPTIGAVPGPGFHWDSVILCDITIAADNAAFDDDHLFFGLVPGDGMFMLMQFFMGVKRANYYAATCRQFTAQQALDWGFISEIVPHGQVVDRAWEIARMLKSLPYETRTIFSDLCKRPLVHLLANDLKLHTVEEQYSTVYRIAQNDYGNDKSSWEEGSKGQTDEKDMGMIHHFRFRAPEFTEFVQSPIHSYDEIRQKCAAWGKKVNWITPYEEFGYDKRDAEK